MKVITFTDTMIRKLKPADKKLIKGEGNGFNIRVMPTGVKTWLYLYNFDGKRKEMNLGTYPAVTLETARSRFDAARARVKNGFDPMEEKEQAADERRKAPTVENLIDEYIKKHAKVNKRQWQEDERLLNKDALPTWGKRKAADIKKRDVVLLLESIVERGSSGTANSFFRCIRKMFNWSVERDILEHSPCDGVKMPAPVNSRDRVLSEKEIKTLWNSLDSASISDEIKRAIKLIFITAQRPGEVIGMHTDEIDKDGRWWTIPVERSKNKKAHRVYLTDTALELIGSLTVNDKKTGEVKPRGFIFDCPIGKKIQPISEKSLSKAIRRNLAWPVLHNGKPVFGADGKPVTENRLGVEHFTPHDGRRSAATIMSKLGFMDEVIDALLNHSKQGVIKTYNQNKYDKEKQAALVQWELKLKSIIAGKQNEKQQDNVIQLNGRKRA